MGVAAGTVLGCVCATAQFSNHPGHGLSLAAPPAVSASCSGTGQADGSTVDLTNLGSMQGVVAYDSPTNCGDTMTAYLVNMVDNTTGACGTGNGSASVGWFTGPYSFTNGSQSSPHMMYTYAGVGTGCVGGAFYGPAISGTHTYREDVHGTKANPNCLTNAAVDFYMDGTLIDSGCVDWVAANEGGAYGDDFDATSNELTDANGVTFSSLQYCAKSINTADCTPSTSFPVTSTDTETPYTYFEYKRTSANSFVICDSRATPNPCS